MGVFLSLAVFHVYMLTTAILSVTVRAVDVKYHGKETLLLTSSDSSYNTSPSTLSKWVNDLLREANETESSQLELASVDTQVIAYFSSYNCIQ